MFTESVNIVLPGTACAGYNDDTVNVTHDLQYKLSLGDFVKVGGYLAQIKASIDEAGGDITTYQIRIHPPYKKNTTGKT